MNTSPSPKPINRREFLRDGTRYAVMAGLAAVAARMLTGRESTRGGSCAQQGICRGCPTLPDCGLPQALSARAGENQAAAYEEIARIPGASTPSRHLEFGPDGLLYLATGKSILVLNQTGERLREIALDAPVRSLALAPDGTLYAALRDHLELFDPQGKRLAAWETPGGKKTWLTGLAVGESDLFVADAGNRLIHRYDRSGRLIGRIGEKNPERGIPGFIIPSPYFSVKLHPDGLLRVNNPGRHRVEAYTPEGDFETSWGSASGSIDGFCGCCNPVNLALLPDGRTVTCEKGVPRVKIYSAAGEFQSVLASAAAFPENAKVGAGERDADHSLAGLTAAADSRGRIAILDLVTGEIRLLQPKGGVA